MEIISFEKRTFEEIAANFRGDCRQAGSLRAASGKYVP